jgi:uncharacterized integral membrane protein (TIGR00697 family)
VKFSPWFLFIATIFTTCLITANIIAVKIIFIAGFALPAGVVIFPLSYLFGDVLTEVYGFGAARIVIWSGFLCNLVAVLAFMIAGVLPAAPYWHDQSAYTAILGFTPHLLLASFISFLCGEFMNSFVLAKLKIATKGRYLWLRTIGSTIVGEGIDTVIFVSIAFIGSLPASAILTLILAQWVFKVLYEVVATPLTYFIVGFLKRKEQLDTYDYHTNFNPFRLFLTQPAKGLSLGAK